MIVPLDEGIREFVHDSDTVSLEGFAHLVPVAAGHESIRQRWRDLTLARKKVMGAWPRWSRTGSVSAPSRRPRQRCAAPALHETTWRLLNSTRHSPPNAGLPRALAGTGPDRRQPERRRHRYRIPMGASGARRHMHWSRLGTGRRAACLKGLMTTTP